MPEIPVYDKPLVAPDALPAVRQSSVASPGMLAQQGQEAQRMGDAVSRSATVFARIAAEQEEKEDLQAVFTAEAGLLSEFGEYKRQAAETRRGVNSKGLGKDTAQWWNEKIGEYTGTMPERQKLALQQRIQRTRLSAVDSMAEFEAAEQRTEREKALTATITLRTTDAVGAVGTTQEAVLMNDAKGAILQSVRASAQTEGWRKEREEEVTRAVLHNFHGQILQRLAADEGGAQKAAAYFEANRGEMDAAKSDELIRLTAAAKSRDTAANAVDTLLGKATPEGEGLEWIRTNLEGEAREQARLRWKEHFADQAQAVNRTQTEFTDRFYTELAAKGSISKVDPLVLQRMDPKVLVSERRLAEDRARVAAGGESKIKTDWGLYTELRSEALRDPTAFAKKDMRQYLSRLAPAQLEQVLDLQNQAAKPSATGKDWRTISQRIGDVRDSVSWPGGNNGKEAKGKFEFAASQEVDKFVAQNKREPDAAELNKIVGRLLLEGKVERPYVWDRSARMFEVLGTPDEAKFSPVIPDTDRKMVVDALRTKRGPSYNPTEQEIIDTFKRAKGMQ